MSRNDTPLVLVVDDEPAQRALLSYNLEAAGFRVATASDGEEALLLVAEESPDVILLDWMLPRVSGIEVCRQLKAQRGAQDAAIIMVSARSDESDRVRGLETGADDYITKPFDFAELEARCRAVLRRRGGEAQSLRSYADLVFDPFAATLTVAGESRDLRSREMRLFELFIAAPGRILSKDHLCDRLFSFSEPVSDNAIEVYVGRLRKKLAGSRTRIETVRGLGYRLTDQAGQGGGA